MLVFGVKFRLGLIGRDWQSQLYAVIGNVCKGIDGVMPLAIGGFKDHVHVLISTNGDVADNEIVRKIKSESSRWVNKHRLCVGRFGWQEGAGKFSYTKSDVPAVKAYIDNQQAHHTDVSYRDEYIAMLRNLGYPIADDTIPGELE